MLRCKYINPLNAELNPICHLLALLGGATIVVVSWLRVKCLLAFSVLFVSSGIVCLILRHFNRRLTFAIMWCVVEYREIHK